MPLWNYEARDSAGKAVQGTHQALDRQAALVFLRQQGLFLTKLEAAPTAVATGTDAAAISRPDLLRAPSQDLSHFYRQMAALLHAGVSLVGIMNSMAAHATNANLRRVAAQMEPKLVAGQPLSEAMSEFPGLFAPLHIGMIRIGERIGRMELIFNRLSKYCESDYQWRLTFQRETYPLRLWFFGRVVLVAVLIFICALVGSKGSPFVIGLLVGVPMVVFLALLFLLYRTTVYYSPLFFNRPQVRLWFDGIKWRSHIVGKVVQGLATAKFCRALGELHSAGIGPGESVPLAAGACGNEALGRRLRSLAQPLANGEKFTDCFAATGYFPDSVIQVIRVGEETGNLDEQLGYAATMLEGEAEVELQKAVKKVLLILVGRAVVTQ